MADLQTTSATPAPAASPVSPSQTPATPTPAATPTTAPSTPTPASATPPQGPPRNARESIERTAARLAAESPTAEPVAPEGATPTTADAISTPAATPTESGPIPLDRHRTILENTRVEARTEVLRSLGVNSVEDAQAALTNQRRLATDPVAFYRQLGEELSQHPQHQAALTPAPAAEPEPQPDLFTEVNGERLEVYSAKQLREWHKWNQAQTDQRFQQLVNPMQEWVGTQQQAEETRQIIDGARTEASQILTEMRTYPHFTTENEPKIANRLAAMDPALKKRLGSVGALHRAYNDFLKEEVFPNIDASAEDRVRGDFKRSAAAGVGSIKPGGPSAVPAKRPSNPTELAAHMRRMAGVG